MRHRMILIMLVIFLFLAISPLMTFSGERLVDEGTVNAWGYKTNSIDKYQVIKNGKIINKNGPAIYPRFNFTKECHKTPLEALSSLESIKNLKKINYRIYDKTYRIGFVAGSCLYIVDIDSNMCHLEYQTQIF